MGPRGNRLIMIESEHVSTPERHGTRDRVPIIQSMADVRFKPFAISGFVPSTMADWWLFTCP